MKKSRNIFLLGPFVNVFFVKVFTFFLRPKSVILDIALPQNKEISYFEKFYWNKYNPSLKNKINGLVFNVLDRISVKKKSDLSNLLFDDKNNFLLYKDIERKILSEKIVHCLLLFGLANKFSAKDTINLILPYSYKSIYEMTLDYIRQEDNNIIKFNNNIKPLFTGNNFFDYFKKFIHSVGVIIYFLFSIKRIKKQSKKSFKIGLLSWNSALDIFEKEKEEYGLDCVLPKDFNPSEVLIYSKNNISQDFMKKALNKKYSVVNFRNKEIFKSASLDDVFDLIFILKNIFYVFIKRGFCLDPFFVSEYPKIIYFFLQWNKFVKSFYFDISISYNDYGLSDLIRNYIFIKNKIACWGYVHSCSQKYVYINKPFLIDPSKSFITFSKRYYLLKDQIKHYNLSRINCQDNQLIGPLFSNYKATLDLEEIYKKKFIISIFPCSEAENNFNPLFAHKKFFDQIFKIISQLNNEYLILIKVKNKKSGYKDFENIFNSNLYLKLKKNNKILFIDRNFPSAKIINTSNIVISMAFTSPTIEALSTNIPAIFFDPEGIAKNNYFKGIKNIYISDWKILKQFVINVKDNKNIDKWLKNTKKELGLESNKLGILKIHNDIISYLKKTSN